MKDAGFTPAKINITAAGIIKVAKGEQLLLQVNGIKQRFILMDLKDTTKVQFISYSKAGISIKITGIVHQHADGSWDLSLKTFEEVK